MKNSLPGRYSHRSRTLALRAWLLELYCRSALANMRIDDKAKRSAAEAQRKAEREFVQNQMNSAAAEEEENRRLAELRAALSTVSVWEQAELERAFHAVVERHGLKLGKLAQPVRVAITGRTASPGIFETLAALGRDWTLARLDTALDRTGAGD